MNPHRDLILRKASSSSYADLMKETGLSYSAIASILWSAGRKIGLRRRVRINTPHPARQLEILADLKFAGISMLDIAKKHRVTRELVGQIAADGRRLGLL